MTRWHSPECQNPTVTVVQDKTAAPIEGGQYIARCESCGRRAPSTREPGNGVDAGSAAGPPPDVPRGQMRLWWPRSVPYSEPQGTTAAGQGPEDHAASSAREDTQTTERDNAHSQSLLSPIYGSELDQHSFRLACLTACPEPNYPIHVDLEVYELNNCPEYEAVSYTWGGEEGNSESTHSIYIGPYWDVLWQTRNCWDMLRFMRPRRGIRLIWVDALCINQSSIPERSVQVRNMGMIYAECTRVVCYLGPDMAPDLPVDRFPRRYRLHELGSSHVHLGVGEDASRGYPSPLTLETLLQRRYFSRLWVVQELLLSKRTLIRVGGTDFWTDIGTALLWPPNEKDQDPPDSEQLLQRDILNPKGGVSVELEKGSAIFSRYTTRIPWWDSSAAPWLRHVSGGAMAGITLPQLLSLTINTGCADPRDRLFGLLSMFSFSETQGDASPIQADYSLSCQQMYIGLCAHLIIDNGLWNILFHASGLASGPSSASAVPSWMPDWTSDAAMRRMWTSPALLQQSQTRSARRWGLPLEVNWERVGARIPTPRTHHLIYLKREKNSQSLQAFESPTIDAKTGALSTRMTRFLKIPSQPKRFSEIGSWFLFRVSYDRGDLFLYSQYRLDQLVHVGTDHLYMLDGLQLDDSVGYLILRQCPSPGRHHTLVASCTSAWFSFPSALVPKHTVPEPGLLPRLTQWGGLSLHYDGAIFTCALHGVLGDFRAWLDESVKPFEKHAFPRLQSHDQLVPIIQAFLNGLKQDELEQDELEQDETTSRPRPKFEDLYAEFVGGNKVSYHGEKHVSIALSGQNQIESIARQNRDSYSPQFQWEIIVPERPASEDWRAQEPALSQSPTSARALIAMQDVRKYLLNYHATFLLQRIRLGSRQTGESVSKLISRNPREGDHLINIPLSPNSQALIDIFQCEAVCERVSII